MTDDEMLDAAERYESERTQWSIRVNKAKDDFHWEIVRIGVSEDEPEVKVVVSARNEQIAQYELEIARGVACMKAALSK